MSTNSGEVEWNGEQKSKWDDSQIKNTTKLLACLRVLLDRAIH